MAPLPVQHSQSIGPSTVMIDHTQPPLKFSGCFMVSQKIALPFFFHLSFLSGLLTSDMSICIVNSQ